MARNARFSVRQSSWFDTHEYNLTTISEAVKSAGGTNVRSTNRYAHLGKNQPKVVTFGVKNLEALEEIKASVEKAVGTVWIIIDQE